MDIEVNVSGRRQKVLSNGYNALRDWIVAGHAASVMEFVMPAVLIR
tara:strand:- start:244 stop:381 length:138 start_codon:yes stop_codon:yes gene_type:complete